MILGLDHVGMATNDPEEVGGVLTTLGMNRVDSGVAEDYGVNCEFWQVGADLGTSVEVVSPARTGSAIDGRLTLDGPGLYHIALVVDDLTAESERLRDNGFVSLDLRPCRGAKPGMRVMFMYADLPSHLFVELITYSSVGP